MVFSRFERIRVFVLVQAFNLVLCLQNWFAILNYLLLEFSLEGSNLLHNYACLIWLSVVAFIHQFEFVPLDIWLRFRCVESYTNSLTLFKNRRRNDILIFFHDL